MTPDSETRNGAIGLEDYEVYEAQEAYSCTEASSAADAEVEHSNYESDTDATAASDFVEVDTPWPLNREKSQRMKDLIDVRSKCPGLSPHGTVAEVQRWFDIAFKSLMFKTVMGGKGFHKNEAALRAAYAYILRYAAPGTCVPTRAAIDVQETMASLILEVRYKCPDSQDPENYSVYYRKTMGVYESIVNGETKRGKSPYKTKKPVNDEVEDSDPEEAALNLTKNGRLLYVGIKRTRAQVSQMSLEDRRYCLCVMKEDDLYIDASEIMTTGLAAGRRCITALINTQRHDVELNNMRFVAPTKRDIGEMEFKRYQPGKEVLVAYCGDYHDGNNAYDLTYAKLEQLLCMVEHQVFVSMLPRYKRESRTADLIQLKQYVRKMDMRAYTRMREVTRALFKSLDPSVKRVRHLISIIEGMSEEEYPQVYDRNGLVTMYEIHFPLHLLLIDEYRRDMKFTNWRDPAKPKFDIMRYVPLLNQVIDRRLVYRSLTDYDVHHNVTVPMDDDSLVEEVVLPIKVNQVTVDSDSESEEEQGEQPASGASSSSTARPVGGASSSSSETRYVVVDSSDTWSTWLNEAGWSRSEDIGLSSESEAIMRRVINVPLSIFQYDSRLLSDAEGIADRLRVLTNNLANAKSDPSLVEMMRGLTRKVDMKIQSLKMQRHIDLTADSVSMTSSEPRTLNKEQRASVKETRLHSEREVNSRLKTVKSALAPVSHVHHSTTSKPSFDEAADKAERRARKVESKLAEQAAFEKARLEREAERREIRARLEAEELAELERIKVERKHSMHKAAEPQFNDAKARAQIRQRDEEEEEENSEGDNRSECGSTHSRGSHSSGRSRGSSSSGSSHSSSSSRSHYSRKKSSRKSRSSNKTKRDRSRSPRRSKSSSKSSTSSSHSKSSKPARKYMWEHRPIPDNRESEYEQVTNLKEGVFNHRWNPTIGMDTNGRYMTEKVSPIPNIHLKFAKRKKHPEESLTQDQMGCTPFDGTRTIEFIETLLTRMHEYHIHPAAMLVGLQEGKWMSKDTGNLVKDMSRIDRDAVGYKRVSWNDKDCIEKAISGLDDLIPRLLELFPDYSQKHTDPQAVLRKMSLTTVHVGGIEMLFNRIRTQYNKLPKDVRTNYRMMVETLEQAIARNPHREPETVVHLYHTRKRDIARRLNIDLNDISIPAEKRIQNLTAIIREMNIDAVLSKEVDVDAPKSSSSSSGNRHGSVAHSNGNGNGAGSGSNGSHRYYDRQNSKYKAFKQAQQHGGIQLNVITNGEIGETSFETHTTHEDADGYSSASDDERERFAGYEMFCSQYDRTTHTRDGKPAGQKRDVEMEINQITCNLLQMQLEPNNANINAKHQNCVPFEDREFCVACGYTGHNCKTCSIVDDKGVIDKNKLAGMQKVAADRRMFASWSKGGQLKGLSAQEYKQFVAEVDAIRDCNPDRPHQYPRSGGGGGRGAGGSFFPRGGNGGGNGGGNNYPPSNSNYPSNGSFGGRNQTYGGARGTSQRGNWSGPNPNTQSQGYGGGAGMRSQSPGPYNGGNNDQSKRWEAPNYIPKALTQGTTGSSCSMPNMAPGSQVPPAAAAAVVVPPSALKASTAANTLLNTIRAGVPPLLQTRKKFKVKHKTPRNGDENNDQRRVEEVDATGRPITKRQRSHDQSIVLRMMGYEEPANRPQADEFWYKERQVNNNGLTFFRVTIFPVEDLGNADAEPSMSSTHIQYDGGAGNSVISPEFAKLHGYKLYQRSVTGAVIGFNGAKSHTEFYVIVGVEVEGYNVHGELVKRQFTTQALVTPQLHAEMILGSEVAKAHNVVVKPDENVATIFRGEDTLTVPCMPYAEFQAALRLKRQQSPPVCNIVRVHAMNHEDDSSEPGQASVKQYVPPEKYSSDDSDAELVALTAQDSAAAFRAGVQRRQVLDRRETQVFMNKVQNIVDNYCCIREYVVARTRESDLLDLVLSEPIIFSRVLKKRSQQRYILAMLIMLVSELQLINQCEHATESIIVLDKLIFACDQRKLIGSSEMDSEAERPEVQTAAVVVKLLVETHIYNHPMVELEKIRIHSMTEAVEVFDSKVQEEMNDWLESTLACQELLKNDCTECLEDERPEGFPQEDWRYVHDKQKPYVRTRWMVFDGCTPERRQEVIDAVMKIDISMETRSRRQEAPFFRAQNLAHLTSFEHPDLLNQPTVDGFEFTIEMEPSNEGPCVARFQRFDPWETQFLHVKLKRMILEKKMERSTSAWNARLVLVPYPERMQKFIQKHGERTMELLHDEANEEEVATFYRLTTDMRGPNSRTVPMIYPLPNIADIISACEGCDRYTTGDCRDAFWTIKMEQISRQYTAFSTPEGHFQYTVMPQGARNAATYWAEMIATVYRPMLERRAPIMVYQDDIGNRAKGLRNHLWTQEEILLIMETNRMVFKTTKQHCNYTTQRILGQILNRQGRMPDPKTLEAIRDLKPPTTLKEVRSIIGLFQYAREYIHSMSSIMDPIQQLTKKGVDIVEAWDPEVHGVALETLKIALTTAPILKTPDLSKPFRIEVDACRVGRGIGAILLQEDDDGVFKPCAYYSRALTVAERRYSATELELTAMHNSILHWKVYLRNHHEFHVIVDHYALVYMVTKMGSEQQNQRLQRLCLDLQGFRFRVTHQAGVKHIGADAVSRLLRNNEEHYVLGEDELRDDWGPLDERSRLILERRFNIDRPMMEQVIDEKRAWLRSNMTQAELDKLAESSAVPGTVYNKDHVVTVEDVDTDADEREELIERDNDSIPSLATCSTQQQADTPAVHCNIIDCRCSEGVSSSDPYCRPSVRWQRSSTASIPYGVSYGKLLSNNEKVEAEWRNMTMNGTGAALDTHQPTINVQQVFDDDTMSQYSQLSSDFEVSEDDEVRAVKPWTNDDLRALDRTVEQPPGRNFYAPGVLYNISKEEGNDKPKQYTSNPDWRKKGSDVTQTTGSHDRERIMSTLRRKIATNELALRQAMRVKTNCIVRWNGMAKSRAQRELNDMERRANYLEENKAREVLRKARELYDDLVVEDMQDRWNNRAGTNSDEKFRNEGTWQRGAQLPPAAVYRDSKRTEPLSAVYGRVQAERQRAVSNCNDGVPKPGSSTYHQGYMKSVNKAADAMSQMIKDGTYWPTTRKQFEELSTHKMGDEDEYGVVHPRPFVQNKVRFELSKNVSSYKTKVLERALHTGDVTPATDITIRRELARRRKDRTVPSRQSTSTEELWKQLGKLAVKASCKVLSSMEEKDLCDLQQEIYLREMRTERLKVESDVRNIERGVQQASTNAQLDAMRSKIEELTLQNSKWAEQFEQLSKSCDRIVTKIQQRMSNVVSQLGDDVDEVFKVKSNYQTEPVHVFSMGVVEEPVVVHMMDSRKDQLKRNLVPESQVNETPVERAQRQARALEVQRRAQAQSMKVQKNKSELLARMQRNTANRLTKMKDLERELKRLAEEEKRTASNEFANEAIELAIDRKIEDHGDFLIGQYYLDESTGQLYQVIDVKIDKSDRHKRLVSVARPIDTIEAGVEVQRDRQTLLIHGKDGAIDMITRFEQGKQNYDDVPLPKSNAEWLRAQRGDPHVQELLNRLGDIPGARLPMDGKSVEDSEEYLYREIEDDMVTLGMLMRRTMKEKRIELREANAVVQQEYKQVVVPESMKEKLIWIMHDQMGHPGRNRTTETIKLRYHWSGMYTDVMNYCKGCRYCNLRKAHNRVAKVPIQIYNYAERPNSRVHFDTAGPFPLANNGGYYILVLKDALTKWITLIPVHSKDMYTVQKAYLEHWTSIYGAPEMLITDRGTEFHNMLAKQLAELWGVRKISTTPKNPRSDGQVENQMRTVKDMLASYIKKNQTDWDEYLPLVAQAYNTTCNSATGMTPYFLMYGREMNMASEEHNEMVSTDDYHEMVIKVKEVQQWYWAYAGSRVVKNSEHGNRVPAERLQYKPYQVGDFFYHRVVPQRAYKSENEEKAEKVNAKLQFRYVGPYMVTEVVSPTVFGATVHGKNKRVHALNMKPASLGRQGRKETQAERIERIHQDIM